MASELEAAAAQLASQAEEAAEWFDPVAAGEWDDLRDGLARAAAAVRGLLPDKDERGS